MMPEGELIHVDFTKNRSKKQLIGDAARKILALARAETQLPRPADFKRTKETAYSAMTRLSPEEVIRAEDLAEQLNNQGTN